MSRTVFCRKYHTELPGLEKPPYPGAKGQDIFEHVSQQAWQEWQAHQTMLINEYRLSMIEAKSRTFLLEEMDKFLFGSGSEKPAGYKPASL